MYTRLTANYFGEEFENKRGKCYSIDNDYSEDMRLAVDNCAAISILPQIVQSLVDILFEQYTSQMILEFDLDFEKIPLGKLTEKQFTEAAKVLRRIEKLTKPGVSPIKFEAASNEFYALIPQNLGYKKPPVIDTIEIIAEKKQRIDCLRDMRIKFKFLNKINGRGVNPIDSNYKFLKTRIEPLDRSSKELDILMKYVKNGEDAADNFKIEVVSASFK